MHEVPVISPKTDRECLVNGMMASALDAVASSFQYEVVAHYKAGSTPLGVEALHLSQRSFCESDTEVPQNTLLVTASHPARNTVEYSLLRATSEGLSFGSPLETIGVFCSWAELLDGVATFGKELVGSSAIDEMGTVEELHSPYIDSRSSGPLDLPWELVGREPGNDFTPFGLFSMWAAQSGARYHLIFHPETTVSCGEKLRMIADHQSLYAPYGEIRIAQGSLLTFREGESVRYVLVLHDGEVRLNLKGLKRDLDIPKKRDLRFAEHEQVFQITGLLVGAVSPFVECFQPIDSIVFDSSLLGEQLGAAPLYDFALDGDRSVLAYPEDILSYFEGHPRYIGSGEADNKIFTRS